MGNINKICIVCENDDKNIEHALFHCNHTMATEFSSPYGVLSHRVPHKGLVEW